MTSLLRHLRELIATGYTGRIQTTLDFTLARASKTVHPFLVYPPVVMDITRYGPTQRRHGHRVTVKGDGPFYRG
jgi:hypothetical protein